MPKGKAAGSKKEVEKKVQKIVEDKTFGLKNKNKSKKVQQYVAQVTQATRAAKSGEQVRPAEWYAAQEARKKKEKEEKKQIEREMAVLLANTKSLKQKEEEKQKLEQEKKALAEAQAYEQDFAVPITLLEQVFRVEGKSIVPRCCGELVWKDNLVNKEKSIPQVRCKVSDGSTRLPLPVVLIGWTPSTFTVKQGAIVDIRNAIAMIRGESVDLELTLGTDSTIFEATPRVAEHVQEMKRQAEENRERGGVPLEELIEEQRARLKASDLTPLTEERFLAWKANKLKRKKEEAEKNRKEMEAKHSRTGANVLSGRALFEFDPSLFKDDEQAETKYDVPLEMEQEQEEEEQGQVSDGDEDEDGDEDASEQGEEEDEEEAEA